MEESGKGERSEKFLETEKKNNARRKEDNKGCFFILLKWFTLYKNVGWLYDLHLKKIP